MAQRLFFGLLLLLTFSLSACQVTNQVTDVQKNKGEKYMHLAEGCLKLGDTVTAGDALPEHEAETAERSDSGESPFQALLNGDFSCIEDKEQRAYLEACFSPRQYALEYVELDLDGDGTEELFLRLADAPEMTCILHAEGEEITRCWSDTAETAYWVEPLSDGTILETYDYQNSYRCRVVRFQWDEDWETIDSLYLQYGENFIQREWPVWEHNGQAISEDEFDSLYQEKIAQMRVQIWQSNE